MATKKPGQMVSCANKNDDYRVSGTVLGSFCVFLMPLFRKASEKPPECPKAGDKNDHILKSCYKIVGWINWEGLLWRKLKMIWWASQGTERFSGRREI